MSNKINSKVLMSGAEYFSVEHAINAHMLTGTSANTTQAIADHSRITAALKQAGIEVVQVSPPENCQDGVYTANWGLCLGEAAIMSRLPHTRQSEEGYAEQALRKLGYGIIKVPSGLRFSGQGDALPCGDYLFVGSRYRTDIQVHKFLQENITLRVIGLQAVPQKDSEGKDVLNKVTGWPDSHFYDLDLALAVLREDLIAWCPEAFMPQSQDVIAKLPINKIEVSLEEAVNGLACNLVSTGEKVVMSAHAPLLAAQLENYGLQVITPEVNELQKGGGFIRCTTLTLA